MMSEHHVSRRSFFWLIGSLPLIHVLWSKLPTSDVANAPRDPEFQGATMSHTACLACNGSGQVACGACDGTGLWSPESESADIYTRQWARQSGRCAWCNEWGEAECSECGGRGVSATT